MGAPWGGPYRGPGRELNKEDHEPTIDDLIDRLEGLSWTRESTCVTSQCRSGKSFRIDRDGWLWFDDKRIETDNKQEGRLKAIFLSSRNELLMEAYKEAGDPAV